MMIFLRLLLFLMGGYISGLAIYSAVRTFVLPRAAQDAVARWVFRTVRWFFDLRLRRVNTYEDQDRILAFFAPVGLLTLLPIWLILIVFGHTLMFYALGVQPWRAAFTLSGSSLLTLGFAQGTTLAHTILAFEEATTGLILVALLIAYLPTMYTAFSRREIAVTRLEVRAGDPPSATEMLLRFNRLQRLDELHKTWEDWEIWFSDLEESHTALAALVFFRSPQPQHSWVTASGAVLDAAALRLSVLDLPRDPQAALCLRAGYLALRRIADYFRVSYNADATFPEEPISINRAEFDQVCGILEENGLPLRADRDTAWQDFAGWRVNYDRVLLALARMIRAPYAPWSSDRSLTQSP